MPKHCLLCDNTGKMQGPMGQYACVNCCPPVHPINYPSRPETSEEFWMRDNWRELEEETQWVCNMMTRGIG